MRPTCLRCLRPEGFCACRELPVLESRTRVVLLQHPRESRLAICSARLTRVALRNCELHRGFCFEQDDRVRSVLESPAAALLYPGEGSTPLRPLDDGGPAVLVVLDGTWIQTERMLAANPRLSALPRVALAPGRASGYQDLRREPAPHCLSTIEAVASALGTLERDPARFAPMFAAFAAMVSRQLACARGERRNPRHRPARAALAAAAPRAPGGAVEPVSHREIE
jgi:DTW domain-containing protein YfiP